MMSFKLWKLLCFLLPLLRMCNGNLPSDLLNDVANEINTLTTGFTDYVDLYIDTVKGCITYLEDFGIVSIPQWITRTGFGYDRQFEAKFNYSIPGSLGELEYAQTTTHIFVQLVWLPNMDRLHDIIHEVNTEEIASSRVAVAINSRKLVLGLCSLEYAGTQISGPTYPTFIILHFVLYKTESGQSLLLNNVTSTETVSQVILSNGPKKVLMGVLLLAKSVGETISETEADNITSRLGSGMCDTIADFTCCEGTPGTNSDGDSICTCTANSYGACCDKECVNGTVINLPPYASPICKCHDGWGGDSCAYESSAANFVSKMEYNAEECQNMISQHIPYTYTDDLFMITSIAIAPEANKIGITAGSTTTPQIEYRTFVSGAPFQYFSSATNDFLMAVEFPFGQTFSDSFVFEINNKIQTSVSSSTEMAGGTFTIGFCTVKHKALIHHGVTGSVAEAFFVVGLSQFSTLPEIGITTDFSVGTFRLTTDDFTLTSSMEGIIVGYTYVASNSVLIPDSELTELLNCYAGQACDALTNGCLFQHSGLTLVNNEPVCTCKGGFIGPGCRFPC